MSPSQIARAPSVRAALAALVVVAAANGCRREPSAPLRLQPTCATVESLHPDVFVSRADGQRIAARVRARVEVNGRVETQANGRAILHTDDGLELRLAGDTLVTFHDGRGRVERGHVFVTSFGDDERSLRVGPAVNIGISDAAAEIERQANGTYRVITVRGEMSWQAGGRQGRVQQGEQLEGRDDARVRPAGVWDDWTGGAASPQGVAQRGSRGVGSAVIHVQNGEVPAALAVNEHRVQVQVEGDVAITTVSQRFFNGADQTAAVEYRVRIPDGAIVAGFTVERDGATIPAVPGAVSRVGGSSPRAALLMRADGELFAHLDPLASGQTVRCEIRYVEWLAHDQGWRTYTYPMGDPVNPPFVGEFSFDLRSSRANLRAFRGPVGAQIELGRVRLSRSDFRPRADLHVELVDADAASQPSARLWQATWHDNGSENYALVDVDLPPPPEQGSDLVIVLDSSAAMNTGMLSVAGAAVDSILHLLGPNDRIALMFGDVRARPATGAAGQLGAASTERREAILDAISRARPGGATNLHRMLADAYAQLDPRRNGSVLYLGDATPTMGAMDPEQLVEETLRAAPDLRLYVLALGNDAHPDTLARLAARGGRIESAGDQPEAVAAATRMASHALRPALHDVRVELGPTVARPLPESIEQWVVGDPLRVVGLLTGSAPTSVRVRARVGREARQWDIPVQVESVDDAGDIRRRWAQSRWRALDAVGASRGALADLGVRFGLITSASALILGGPVATTTDGGGFECAGSDWPDTGLSARLPRLGVRREVAPRGVPSIYEDDEEPMVSDDGAGWRRHVAGEGAGRSGAYQAALGSVETRLWACFDRSRALRPSLSGAVTLSAEIAADGHVSVARVDSSSLGDASAESCMRNAVLSLRVPEPSLLGLAPGTATRTFTFAASPLARRGAGCPPTSRIPRAARMVLWRERIREGRGQLVRIWTDANARCELRVWEDRVALMDLLVHATANPVELADLRGTLQPDARDYFDRIVARRWGPSSVWRAYMAEQGYIDWDALLRSLNDENVPIERKIQIAQAFLELSPHDMDLRIRMMMLFERAGRAREARRIGDDLRHDAFADSRVRSLVGEMLIRLGDRDEGLRAFSEIAEFSPYDTDARSRLGDLMITYGGREWADEAYLQYRTLALLLPGDPEPQVRMAIAAALASRLDEALRLLRAVAEESGGDVNSDAAEALLVTEVARLGLDRRGDAAADTWTRVARLMHLGREGALVARWDHPDVRLELRTQQSGDTAFLNVGEADLPYNLRVFAPQTAMDGSRVLLRIGEGVAGARRVTAHLALLRPEPDGPRLIERDVVLDATTRYAAFVVRNGQLVEDTAPLPDGERPPPPTDMY